MTNGDLRQRAAALLPGVVIRRHHIDTALRRGFIRAEKGDDGWHRFDESAVLGLVDYMRRRSRTAIAEMEAASNA